MNSIIFDLDDTLYKDKELRGKREQAIVSHLGQKVEKYRELKKIMTTTKALAFVGVDRKQFYSILNSVEINLKQDIALSKLLSDLKKSYKLVVLSNSPFECVAKTIEKLGITLKIDEIYSGDMFNMPKPSEESFTIVKKGDICIGNNFEKDLLIPKQKGAVAVLISEKNDCRADFVINSIHDLPAVIDKLNLQTQH
jgi:FMN phosphatase YigB (HAD superfamily)